MISVVIPVYNRFTLLCEAVESVLAQQYRDFELIIVDDGSDDFPSSGSLPPIFSDKRIFLQHIRHCGMPGKVRNTGVAAAGGGYVAFLDSDDLWLPEKLLRQQQLLTEKDALTLLHTREVWLRNDCVVSQRKMRHRHSGDIFSDALQKCIIGPSTVILKRSLFLELGGFREDMEIAEDYEFWLRWCALEPVDYLDEPLVIKRAGRWDQLSEKYGQIEKFRIDGLHRLVAGNWFAEHAGLEQQQLAEGELQRKCRIYAAGARKRGRVAEAERYEALMFHPSGPVASRE